MAQQLFANSAFSSLASTITNVATSITLATGHGSRFPTPSGGDHFLATLVGVDSNGNENSWEIVKVTTRSADVLTVVRGQEGSTALPWVAGSRIELRATSGTFAGLLQLTGGTVTGPVTLMNGAYTAFKVGLTGLVSIGGEAGSADSRLTITNGGAVGLEFSQTAIAGQNRILSYNRLATAFVPLSLAASEVRFNISGTDVVTINGSGVTGITRSMVGLADAVTGPASSTDNTLPRFDGTEGKLLQGSGVAVDDNGNISLSAGGSPWTSGALHMQFPYGAVGNSSSGYPEIINTAYESATNVWRYTYSGLAATRFHQAFGNSYWSSAPSGTVGNTLTWNSDMFLESGGSLYVKKSIALERGGSPLYLTVANFGETLGGAVDSVNLNIGNGGGGDLRLWSNSYKATLTSTGSFLVHTGTIGYGAGAGGTGTVASGTVPINKPNGLITLNTASLGAGAHELFNLTNTFISVGDHVVLTIDNSSFGDKYRADIWYIGAALAGVRVANVSPSSRGVDALTIRFAVIKGSTT